MITRPWDPGLQNERTTLAWIRTAAALAAGGLGAAATALRAGPAALAIPFALAALAGGTLLVLSGGGYRRAQRALLGRAPYTSASVSAGRPLAAWVGTLAVAAGALAFILGP